ncbi:hypothetical protein [Streptosporangium roseum]|uniref:Uncharacterized protein n=1 Tax=Streptosporangium roseum (strain ATCC 12428 / DSM 43021 / JCM 3005 / KCTC 9067 / NCIMB 10171 / NRRL 2505 / NI 9100) TaxID=479432 RepID=D2AV13_STRRD|nr:hypothetical protein [Streptosporangium roseum]ACZ86875.1 conserved hypothetical protein [Streptosporangium roseum DSM 43021]
MAFEEKRAWVMIVVSVGAYTIYVATILGLVGDGPLADVAYAGALLWTIGGAIVAAIVAHIAMAIAGGHGADRTDERDREINQVSERIGQSIVVIGALAALVMAIAELRHFWIANAVYLAFVLSAVLSSFAKIMAYRKGGFQTW